MFANVGAPYGLLQAVMTVIKKGVSLANQFVANKLFRSSTFFEPSLELPNCLLKGLKLNNYSPRVYQKIPYSMKIHNVEVTY